MFLPVLWQGQKDSNPRHAVLEWMWGSAAGSGRWAVLPDSPSRAAKVGCWFGAAGWKAKGFDGVSPQKMMIAIDILLALVYFIVRILII